MANSVGIRFNNIEEERVLGAMLAAGDENVSTHIKRVYFAALDRKDDYTHQISPELDQIQQMLTALQEQLNESAASADAATPALAEASSQQQEQLLTLVSGIYRMLRQAVPATIQRDADQVINYAAIEEYLKPTPQDDDNATTIDATSPDGTEQSGGGRRARPLSPYALGKLQAQEEIAHRLSPVLAPEALVAPVTQKRTLTQKIIQHYRR